jgi:protein TonB
VAAIATSLVGHAILILGLVTAGSWVAEKVEDEPVRLVFVEPAPPPKLGTPTGGAAAAPPAAAAAEQAAPQPQPPAAMERIAEPVLYPPRPQPAPQAPPKPVAKAATKPQPAASPAAPPAPPAEAARQPDAAGTADATTPGPRGVADGAAAGAEGRLPGGQVGGLGTEVTPLSRAAVAPTVTRRVVPRYPESARMRGIEGQVVIEAIVARDGSVEPGMKVVQSIPALDEAALEAFRQWRFTPGRDASGRPLRVILQAPVRFVLR